MNNRRVKHLLISPNHSPYNSERNISRLKTGKNAFPLDLGYIGTQLDLKGNEVKLLFANKDNLSLTDVEREIDEYLPDFVGVSSAHGSLCLASSIQPTLELINLIRHKSTDIKIIVLGGLSSMFEELLLKSGADVVIRKEPELKFIEVVENFYNLEPVRGIGFRKNGHILQNGDDNQWVDLNLLPPINYHLFTSDHLNIEINPMTFDYALPGKKIAIFETNRGCPYKCSFCYRYLRGSKVRHKSIDRVLNEIQHYKHTFGVNRFYIIDNTFTINREYVINLCEQIKELPFKTYWRAVTRSDCIDIELLRKMKEAGCYNLGIGLESADNEILKKIKKKCSAEDIEQAVKICRDAGITVGLYTLFFLPGETLESIERTLRLAARMKVLWVGTNIATPIPGTELYEIGLREGKLKGEKSRLLEECIEAAGTIGNNFTPDEVRMLNKKIRYRLLFINLTSDPLRTIYYMIKAGGNIKSSFNFFKENVNNLIGR